MAEQSEQERVSIHAPARGATRPHYHLCIFGWFQFTRPRGARLRERMHLRLVPKVSIHAPARGATAWRNCACSWQWCFNSRAREGRDSQRLAVEPNVQQVSIHAPARGATTAVRCTSTNHQVSIHAPARGATDPKGSIPRSSGFNSRAREGRDR